jgi:hypothetical protein
VKLFYSFTSRNPKDPEDFQDYQPGTNVLHKLLPIKFQKDVQAARKNAKVQSDEVTLVVDKPDTNVECVYLGVKGVEVDNKFEVKFDDCAHVYCNPAASLSTIKLSMLLFIVCIVHFFL